MLGALALQAKLQPPGLRGKRAEKKINRNIVCNKCTSHIFLSILVLTIGGGKTLSAHGILQAFQHRAQAEPRGFSCWKRNVQRQGLKELSLNELSKDRA